MDYDQVARRRLGREIRAARTRAGYQNRNDFAARIKRSARQVQALENGETGVGPDTMAAAAEALGWELDTVYAILGNDWDVMKTPHHGTSDLADVSDEELAAEVLRRMTSARDVAPPAPDPAAGSGASLGSLGRRARLLKAGQPVETAASRGPRRQDEAEPASQDSGDMEPR